MKLWRKHNSTAFVRSHPAMRIRRSERRTYYTNAAGNPSKLLLRMLIQANVCYIELPE